MNDGGIEKETGRATVRSYVDRVHHAVIARGVFTELYERGYIAHASSIGPLPDEEALSIVRAALPLSTLRLALLPPDQYCGWTYNFASPRMNLFLTGDNATHVVTGRVYTEHVKDTQRNKLFVEMQRPHFKPSRSIIEFEGNDLKVAMQTYYDKALQMRARVFDLGNDDVVLIEGLPMVERPWLAGLDAESVRALIDSGELENIEERVYEFRCGCDAEQIGALMQSLFGDRPGELFGDEDVTEVQCPRCGRYWKISRAEVDLPKA